MKKRSSPLAVFLFLIPSLGLTGFFSTPLSAQDGSDVKQEVIHVIKTLFDGMRAADSLMVRSAFHPQARLCTTFTDEGGQPQFRESPIDKFISAVGVKYDFILDERIWRYDVQIDGNLATAWTEYTFFRGDKMSHCGVNAFQLVRTAEGWKILNITDTRRTENCRTEPYPDQGK